MLPEYHHLLADTLTLAMVYISGRRMKNPIFVFFVDNKVKERGDCDRNEFYFSFQRKN
jgi:hypothetical protein